MLMTEELKIDNRLPAEVFLNQAGIELKRAERYRIFVSLIVFDLSTAAGSVREMADKLSQQIRDNVRASDHFAFIDHDRIAVLFPETPRQGAEVTARRLRNVLTTILEPEQAGDAEQLIPVEMVSFPDSGGARTVHDFLRDLSEQMRN